jgi:cation diffusion facilitator family transporter
LRHGAETVYHPPMPKWLAQVPKPEARAALISISVGLILLLVKFAAYFLTDSTAIFADALEGIVNVTASFFAAYALITAHRPADQDHPYGHGKIEFFSAGLEGGMILLAAFVAIAKAGDVLLHHQQIHLRELGRGLALMAIALTANAAVGIYLVRAGRKHTSMTLEADGWHLITDAVTSTAAVFALLLVRLTGLTIMDPVIAVLVSFYIAWTGITLVRRSAAGLMDEQDAGDTAMLRGILDSHVGAKGREPHICSYHKLRHRHNGRYHWIDFHIMMPGNWDIEKGHRIASAIEFEIENAIGEGNATAHIEPCKDLRCPDHSDTSAEQHAETETVSAIR